MKINCPSCNGIGHMCDGHSVYKKGPYNPNDHKAPTQCSTCKGRRYIRILSYEPTDQYDDSEPDWMKELDGIWFNACV